MSQSQPGKRPRTSVGDAACHHRTGRLSTSCSPASTTPSSPGRDLSGESGEPLLPSRTDSSGPRKLVTALACHFSPSRRRFLRCRASRSATSVAAEWDRGQLRHEILLLINQKECAPKGHRTECFPSSSFPINRDKSCLINVPVPAAARRDPSSGWVCLSSPLVDPPEWCTTELITSAARILAEHPRETTATAPTFKTCNGTRGEESVTRHKHMGAAELLRKYPRPSWFRPVGEMVKMAG